MFCDMFSQDSNIISIQEMCTQHFWHVCVHTATNNTGNLGNHDSNGTIGTSVTLISKAAMVTIKLIVNITNDGSKITIATI
jgi:hypothetical protein